MANDVRKSYAGPWNIGNDWLPFHPSASHVPPGYRDGWNDAYWAAQERIAVVEAALREAEKDAERLDWLDSAESALVATGHLDGLLRYSFSAPEADTLRNAIDAARAALATDKGKA